MMGAFEQSEGRRVVRVPTNRRRTAVLSSVDALFGEWDLSTTVVDGIADRALPLTNERGDVNFRSERGLVYLLRHGCVREDFPDGTARLWGPGTLIGDWAGPSGGTNSAVTVLSDSSAGLILTALDIYQIAGEHNQLLFALGRMTMDRLHAAETVYGATKLKPVPRLAKLLLYLANKTSYETRDGDGRRIVTRTEGLVAGPTQADFADALGLSRAAVEKAIAVLRERGVLHKPDPGERRTNRRHMIADRAGLEQLVDSP